MILSRTRRARFAAVLSSFCVAGFAAAQSTPAIVVTGTREPLASERLAADVVVIDADTVRASTADSLADLLRREAGVQISRSGGPGQSSGLFIRGAASQQSVVLVDGVRVGSATLGFAALEALSLASVERIEVLRGPGSSVYGADAVGGVVQIFTAAWRPRHRVRGPCRVGRLWQQRGVGRPERFDRGAGHGRHAGHANAATGSRPCAPAMSSATTTPTATATGWTRRNCGWV